MIKQEKIKLKNLQEDYQKQEKIVKQKLKELKKIKKILLNDLDYQETIDSKEYKAKNNEYIKEKRKSVTLYTRFIKYREELLMKNKQIN